MMITAQPNGKAELVSYPTPSRAMDYVVPLEIKSSATEEALLLTL